MNKYSIFTTAGEIRIINHIDFIRDFLYKAYASPKAQVEFCRPIQQLLGMVGDFGELPAMASNFERLEVTLKEIGEVEFRYIDSLRNSTVRSG